MVEKYENLVDLEKCCNMNIWLQRSASIQKRTSLSKFAKIWPKVRTKVRKNIGLKMQMGLSSGHVHRSIRSRIQATQIVMASQIFLAQRNILIVWALFRVNLGENVSRYAILGSSLGLPKFGQS